MKPDGKCVPTERARAGEPMADYAIQRKTMVDNQIRTVDVSYLSADPVDYLEQEQMARVEHAIAHYLGLASSWTTER